MHTVEEIREAISKLSPEDQSRLLGEMFATIPMPHENDPEFLAALDRALEDDKADRVYTPEEVRAMIPKWISEAQNQPKP